MTNSSIRDRIKLMASEYASNLIGPCAGTCDGEECERAKARREFRIAFEIGASAAAVLAGVAPGSQPVQHAPRLAQELLTAWCDGLGWLGC